MSLPEALVKMMPLPSLLTLAVMPVFAAVSLKALAASLKLSAFRGVPTVKDRPTA